MAYTVTITYTPAKDIFKVKTQKSNIVTAAAIPGITANEMPGEYVGPSKAYLYAADSATVPQYLKEKLGKITTTTTGEGASAVTANTYTDAELSFLTSSQLRWPKSVTNSIINILEAYRTPQVPVFRAWQTFKFAITGGQPFTFAVETAEAASFYVEAGKALANYGFEVATTPSI